MDTKENPDPSFVSIALQSNASTDQSSCSYSEDITVPFWRALRKADQEVRAPRAGFTLIELIVVIVIIGVASTLIALRLGTFAFWNEEGYVRRLSETITFLHHQSVTDQSFYRLEFDFATGEYTIGVIRVEEEDPEQLAQLSSELGSLSLELAAFLSPSVGVTQTVIPPPAFPSLANPIKLPEGSVLSEIRTMRGKHGPADGVKPYILFSPRGFSEFAVIHLKLSGGAPVTILVNPFTGTTEIFREYKDFEWTYGKKKATS